MNDLHRDLPHFTKSIFYGIYDEIMRWIFFFLIDILLEERNFILFFKYNMIE
jgi:hypothetical protein